MEKFYLNLAELVEVDEVKPDDVLRDFASWDSLTVLAVVATLDSEYGVNMTAADMRDIETAGQLASAVESRRRK
jgi:acyl carrier protein